MAKENLQTVASLDKYEAKSIKFAKRFSNDLVDLRKALGVMRVIKVPQGGTITIYGSPEVDLKDGNVAEGEVIPLSKVTPAVKETKKLPFRKHRLETTGEAMRDYGRSQAIDQTDSAAVKKIQTGIRKELFDLIQSGAEQANLNTQGGLQGALATAWGYLQNAFEDDAVKVVAFVNPMDVAQANALKDATLETAFGLSYYTTLTGTIVFPASQVKQGHIYATAVENLVVAYTHMSESEDLRDFDLNGDSTGFLGMTHFTDKTTFTLNTLVISSVLLFVERLDGVVKIPLAAVEPAGE